MFQGLTRRRLLAAMGATAVSGCVNPERCSPPTTDFDVSYEQSVSNGAIIITMTRRPSLATERIRVTVGETVAYEGDIQGEYAAGSNANDGWGEEAIEGEQLILSTGGPIPGFRRLSIELQSSCDAWNRRVRSETPPPPMTISATAERINGTTYLTITHESGVEFPAENLSVSIPGTEGVQGYLRGTITDPVDGPDVIDEWSDGVSSGDRLRLATPDPDPAGRPIVVDWFGHPDGEPRAIARTTIQGDLSNEMPSETPESTPSETVTGSSRG